MFLCSGWGKGCMMALFHNEGKAPVQKLDGRVGGMRLMHGHVCSVFPVL